MIDQSSAQSPTSSPPSETSNAASDSATSQTGAPEKYEFKPADGQTLDQAVLDRATPVFRELNLTQAQAQKLVDTYNAAIREGSIKAVEDMRAGWRKQVTDDREMAGRLDQIKSDIGQLKDTLDPTTRKDFEEAMNLTGAGDHPGFVKAFWKMSQRFIEGKHVSGASPSPNGQRPPNSAPPSLAQQMYPHLPSGNA